MTDHKALIIEARQRQRALENGARILPTDMKKELLEDADAFRRLADALEEAIKQIPEKRARPQNRWKDGVV